MSLSLSHPHVSFFGLRVTKISDLGRIAMCVCASTMLVALAVLILADKVPPPQVVVSALAAAMWFFARTRLSAISRHRGGIAYRACALLPLLHRARDLSFSILILAVRFFAAPARARPRLPAPSASIRSNPRRPGAPSCALRIKP